MAFSYPTLSECVERARKGFSGALAGLDAWLWPNNIGPTAKVIGEGENTIWGRVAVIEKRRFAWSADRVGLLEHGREWGLTMLPATAASGLVAVVADADLSIADGALLTRSDGVIYRIAGASSLAAAGQISIQATAVDPGASANCRPGQALTPTSGVTGTAAPTASFMAATLGGGSDAETTEAFRARILFRKRNPPAAGAPADYVRWASTVPGVAGVGGVFVEPIWGGPGTVRVMILGDGSSGSAVPAPTVVDMVRSAFPLQAPAKAGVTVIAPTAIPVDVTVEGLSPDTTEVREAILAELRDLFGVRRARASGAAAPVAGMPYLASPVTFSRSWVAQAVSAATGEDAHRLTAPAADVVIPSGGLAVLGTVRFLP